MDTAIIMHPVSMDALQFTLTLDQVVEKGLEMLAPHMSAYSLSAPRTMAKTMEIPKPVAGTIANWLEMDEFEPDPEKLKYMDLIPQAA